MGRLQDVILRGTRAAQPAATTVPIGTLYYVTDEQKTERSNGTTWDDYTDGGGGGGGVVKFSAGTLSATRTDITFANSNGVSFGLQTNGVITGTVKTDYQSSGAYLTTAMQSNAATISNVKLSAGTLSANRSDLTFSNSNGVSFGLQTNGVITATVKTDYQSSGAYLTTAALSQDSSKYAGTNGAITGGSITVNTSGVSVNLPAYLTTAMQSNAATISNIKVSAGTLSALRSDLTFSNGSGVSFGLETNGVITASVAAAGGAQTGISGISAGTTLATSGTVSFANSNGVSWGVNGNTLTATVKTDYLTTAMQSNAATISNINVSGGTTSSNLSAFKLVDSNGVSWSLDTGSKIYATVKTDYQTSGAYLTTADLSQNSSKYVQNWKLTGNTAGTTSSAQGTDLWFSGGNSITVSGNSNSIVFSVGAYLTTAMQSNAATISNINLSAGTTSNNLSAFVLSNSNNFSFGLSGSTVTASFSATIQPEGTQSIAMNTLTAGGATGGTSGSATGTGVQYVFHAGSNITLSQSVNGASGSLSIYAPSPGAGGAINFSAGTTSSNLDSVVFSNSNGISFGLSGSTITGTVSTYSTVGTATTVKAVASANSVGTITRWAAEDHAHAGVAAIGISSGGNSAGTSGSEVGTYWLQGGNNITLSQITSNNGSHTLIMSGPSDGTLSAWPNVLPGSTALSTYYSGSTSQGAGGGSTQTGYTFSLYAVPLGLPAALAFSELRIGVSNSRSTAGTGSATHIYSVGIYSNNASTLSLIKGYYGGLYFSQNSITAQSWSVFTLSTGSNSVAASGGLAGLQAVSIYSSAGNISSNSQMEPGMKLIRIDNGVATTLTAGQYYMLFGNATVSASVNVYAQVGVLQSNAISSVGLADLGRENSTQSSNYLPAWGAISTTFTSVSNAATFFPLPASIAISNMSLSKSDWQRFHFPLMRNNS